jgi:PAS domain S-box-containing protein
MLFPNNSKLPLWCAPVFMLACFLAAFFAVILLANMNSSSTSRSELAHTMASASEGIQLRLKGNEDYLTMLGKHRADGSLNAELFQERAAKYVLEHPEIINITWVDADYFIRDVAPLTSNRQILGLHLDLPEPKRASQRAKETRRPAYTAPFEAIQGKPSFEIWIPVFDGDNFLGLFAGVYSCQKTVQSLVSQQVYHSYHASLVDKMGRTLAELPKTGHIDEKLIHKAILTPGDGGVYLQLGSYGLGRIGWALQLLELLCLALVLAMTYAMWALNREVKSRRLTEARLHQKTLLLEEELSERLVSQEEMEIQAALLKNEIEERTRAEESLRESEARFRVLIEQAPDAIVVYDLDSDRFVDANASAEALFGCSRAELLESGPQRFYRLEQPDEKDIAESFAQHNQQVRIGAPVQFERAILTADGRELVCVVHLTKLTYEKRDLIRASFVDITRRKSMEHNLHLQAIQLEEELSERQVAQEALQEQAALLEEEIEERKRMEDALIQSEATVRSKLKTILEPEGDIGTLELSDIIDSEALQAMMDDFYKLTGMLGAVLDVSGKVLVAVGWQDICTKFHRCHPGTLRHCLESDINLTHGVPQGTFRLYHCENNMWDMVTPVVVGGKHVGNVFIGQFFFDDEMPDRELFRAQARQYGFDETEYLAALDRAPRFSRDQVDAGMRFYAKLAGVISSLSFSSIKLSRMLAERNQAKEELFKLMREQQVILDNAPIGISLVKGRVPIWINRKVEELFQSTKEGMEGESIGTFYPAPEAYQQVGPASMAALAEGREFVFDQEMIRRDGTPLWIKFTGRAIDPSDLDEGIIWLQEDISALVRNISDRKLLEEQLRQSQKMEAIGLLAGGVAHDFNNILMVIMGYGNMLKMDNNLDALQLGKIDQILSSADKAAHLTQGLLAFSRRQVLAPKAVDLNDITRNVHIFIARIIGEDIHFKTSSYGAGLTVYADKGQIEQVLINLATNARDAMPKGGILTIGTGLQSVETPRDSEYGSTDPGCYAVITISDTGCGMDENVRKRIFEPFFTTKEVGKGTGLGMAIVYGILKQHNGFIEVYSEPGCGSTFKIFLPIHQTEQSVALAEAAPAPMPQGGTETILLAEDDVDVCNLVVTVLTEFGYQVIQAVDGQDAVDKFLAHRDSIGLILMDMIMPKKNGKDAFEEICRLQPDVKVMYLSGYTADFIQSRGVVEEEIKLIMKPVQPTELLLKVREMLDSKEPHARAG